jgi:DNA-binding CsgD family transcriptional regulator
MTTADLTLPALARLGNLIGGCSKEEMRQALDEVTLSMGFKYFLFAQHQPDAGESSYMVLTGYPESWRAMYVERGYMNFDPTVKHCLSSDEPLPWSPALITPDSREMWHKAASYGIRHGLSLAVHGESVISMLSLSRNEEIPPLAMDFSIGAARAVLAVAHFAALRFPSPEASRLLRVLTSTQLEVLKLCTEGASTREIAATLRISQRTVYFHFQRVFDRMGVRHRSGAVAKAVAIRLVPTARST